jgi:hypothetical protein
MKDFNPFRISFDRPLKTTERTRARIAATIVGGTVVFLGLSSMVALLNASSETIGTWTNAEPPTEARLVEPRAEDPAGKSCEEQTWPYLEARCLTSTDAPSSPRSTPKQGLGSQQISLPDAPVPNAAESPISPTPEGNTGSPAHGGNPGSVADEATATTNTNAVPLPVPAPVVAAPARAHPEPTVRESAAARKRTEAASQLSKRQQRRLQRQERKRLQRQRQEARNLRRERLRAQREARGDDEMFFIFR